MNNYLKSLYQAGKSAVMYAAEAGRLEVPLLYSYSTSKTELTSRPESPFVPFSMKQVIIGGKYANMNWPE